MNQQTKDLNEKLDEKVNRDNLVYEYKNKSPDEEFDKYDNALNLINKIKEGKIKISLSKSKNDQAIFKSDLGEIKRRNNKKKQKSKKT